MWREGKGLSGAELLKCGSAEVREVSNSGATVSISVAQMAGFRDTFPWTYAVGRFLLRKMPLTAAILGVIAVTLLGIQARAWVFRWQARRFVDQVRALEVGRSPAAQAFALRRAWGDPKLYTPPSERPCTPERCDFTIGTSEWITASRWMSQLLPGTSCPLPRGLLFLPQRFGMRASWASANIKIRHGSVIGVSLDVSTATQEDEWCFFLFADITAWPNLWIRRSAPDWHPNFDVHYQGPPNHGGCTGCRGTEVSYTPQISRAEFLQLTQFDLSCLTGFHLCEHYADLLPAMRPIVEADERLAHSRNEAQSCSTRSVEALGRDARSVALMQVESVGPGRPARIVDYDGVQMWHAGEQSVTYAVLQVMKLRHGAIQTRRAEQFLFRGALVDPATHVLRRDWFYPGKKLIVFDDAAPLSCSVLPATEENLAAVRRGISEDMEDTWK